MPVVVDPPARRGKAEFDSGDFPGRIGKLLFSASLGSLREAVG